MMFYKKCFRVHECPVINGINHHYIILWRRNHYLLSQRMVPSGAVQTLFRADRESSFHFSIFETRSRFCTLRPNEKNGNSRIEFSVSISHQTTSRYDEGNDRLHHGDHQPTKAFKTTMKCLGFPSLLFLLALCIFCLSAKATINFGDDENEEEDDLLFVLCFRGCPESCPFQGKMTKAIESLSIL